MYVRGDTRVDAGTCDRERIAPVDLDDIHREDRPVPEIFHIAELLEVVAEVLEQVVAVPTGTIVMAALSKPRMPLATSLAVPSPPQA